MRARILLRPVLALVFFVAFAAAARANDVLDKFDRGLAAYKAGAFETAYAILRPMAETGHAGAQHLVGDMLLRSRKLLPPFDRRFKESDEDSKTARKKAFEDQAYAGLDWIQKAAEQNLIVAQVSMGDWQRTVARVESERTNKKPDFSRAIFWYRRAAMQGDTKAMDWMVLAHTTYGEFRRGPPIAGTDEAEIAMWSIIDEAYRPEGNWVLTIGPVPPVKLRKPCTGDDCSAYYGPTLADLKEAVRRAREWRPMFPELQDWPHPVFLERVLDSYRDLPDQ